MTETSIALVTGANKGIGLEIARQLAASGVHVIMAARDPQKLAVEAEHLARSGRSVSVVPLDLLDQASIDSVARSVAEEFGRLDILVNNAGEQHPAEDIRDISPDQLEQTFATNIFGMFYLVQAALPHLKKGAAIVNCTSVTMYQGSGGLLDYSATKGAITAFTRSLSENLVEKGIRVNAVAPGPIWTPLKPRGGAPADKVAGFGESTPMKRPGEPNEVAPCFLFLACADSSYMSGQVLHPNGGTIVNG